LDNLLHHFLLFSWLYKGHSSVHQTEVFHKLTSREGSLMTKYQLQRNILLRQIFMEPCNEVFQSMWKFCKMFIFWGIWLCLNLLKKPFHYNLLPNFMALNLDILHYFDVDAKLIKEDIQNSMWRSFDSRRAFI